MKKGICLTVMALALALSLAAQAITVTVPNSDITSWYRGSQHTIKWTKTGSMQNVVAIRLRKWGSAESEPAALAITESAPNNGTFWWTIPVSLAPGDYFVRVRTVDSSVIGDSTKIAILKCQPPLMVKSPNGGEAWLAADTKDITWGYCCCQFEGTVRLILLKGGKYVGIIASGIKAADKKYTWKVGNSSKAWPGTADDYKVRIVQEYPGPMVPLHPNMDDSNGNFSIYINLNPGGPLL